MFKIIKKESLNPTVTRMSILAPMVARKAKAGQFIILRVTDDGERIPLTVAGCDREAGTVDVIFQIVGATTMELNAKNEGESIQDFVGPLGRPTEVEGKKKVAVVGGGVGCAIALPVAQALHEAGAIVHSFIGFRNKDLVILEKEFNACSDRVFMMTDDGSYGRKGVVTAPLEEAIQAGENYDEVIAIGPLGRPTEVEGKKKVAVVGGGVGCAIALPVAQALHEAGAIVHSFIGFRNKDLVILEKEFNACSDRVFMMTDDGSYGRKGVVTAPLEEAIQAGEDYDEVIAIGPLIMMKFVCLTTKKYGVKTVVSMNPIMIDGTGMCGGCRLTVGGEMKFACVDGPEFDGHLVDFDEAMMRSATYRDFEARKREETCNLLSKEVE